MATTPAPDAEAMTRICEQLTKQVQRIADALTTPAAIIRDGVLTPLNAATTAPATTCSAQYMKHNEVIRSCIRAAHHIDTGRPHTDERGFHWSDTVAVYPTETRTIVACNEPGPWGDAHACIRPAGHTDDHEAHDGCGWRTGMCDSGHHRQHPGFTCPEVDQTRPYWNVRWEQGQQAPAADSPRCVCGDPIEWWTGPGESAGWIHSPGADTPRLDAHLPRPPTTAPATDEDAARTNRRSSLGALLARAERCALSPADAGRLREDVDAEIREADTARSVAAGNRRHVQLMYADLEQANEAARRALQQRQEMAEERHALQEQRDTADRIRAEAQRDRDQHAAVIRDMLTMFVSVKAEDGALTGYRAPSVFPDEYDRWLTVVAPTVERPWWETVTELRDELAQMRALAPMLDGLHTLLATSSRDWQTYRVDAWLWAVLCGWDCESDEHDETCTHGALEETAAMHGWDDATVTKARRYRTAVRAAIALDESHQAPAEVVHPGTNRQASESRTVDEQPGHASAYVYVHRPGKEGQS